MIDFLFIHAPNQSNLYLPLGQFANNNLVPIGVFGLAKLLQTQGRRVEIVHLGVESLLNTNFSLAEYIRENQVRVVGISLFWFHQSFDALDVARMVKDVSPEIPVVLGGMTASYFAKEILENFSQVDYLISGYAEDALPKLVEKLLSVKKTGLDSIPNLWYRTGGMVVRNAISGVDPSVVNSTSYTDLTLLRNYQVYVENFGLHEMPIRNGQLHRNTGAEGTKMIPIFVGRGCHMTCSYCGGNKGTLSAIASSDYFCRRSVEAVIKDIRLAVSLGYRKLFICFDPFHNDRSLMIELFAEIRTQALDVDLYFECWTLPNREFIDAFSQTFGINSHILISLDTYNEQVRRLHRPSYSSNEEIEATLEYLDEKGVRFDICLSIGMPFSKYKEDIRSAERIKNLYGRYRHVGRIMTFLIDLVPGAPIFEYPERFGIQTSRKSFLDYYEVFRKPDHSTYALLNYKVDNYFDDERDNCSISEFGVAIQHLKCMHLCFLSKDGERGYAPEKGRAHCHEMRSAVLRDIGYAGEVVPINDECTYGDALTQFKVINSSFERSRYR